MTAEPRRGLVLDAPAKLNLYLHVLGRRPDGHHRLDSLVVFLDLCDTLHAAESDRLNVRVRGPWAEALRAAADGDNIVARAARLLAAEAGVEPRAVLKLDKRIPVAAGLGGGSADAAATLRLLDRLWRTRAGADDLARLAARLGADVPVCLTGRPTVMRGIGERLAPGPELPEIALVLANPRRRLATAQVFAGLAPRPRPAARTLPTVRDAAELARRLARRRNDLTLSAAALEPAIPDMLARLTISDARLARMSGSGATCFGLFDDMARATAACATIRAERPEWWCATASIRHVRPRVQTVAEMQQRRGKHSMVALRLDT
ncbi:MAG: 4-(cytidine 5'-diphospho)-2-C-methyl-D-erythritol kinase [Alphaproteobacteria bacterium]